MKKLLFIINTMGQAGAEKALVELLKRLNSMGKYELYLYTIIPCGEMFKAVPDKVHILNKRIYTYSVVSFRGRLIIMRMIIRAFFLQAYRLQTNKVFNWKHKRAKSFGKETAARQAVLETAGGRQAGSE